MINILTYEGYLEQLEKLLFHFNNLKEIVKQKISFQIMSLCQSSNWIHSILDKSNTTRL